MWDARMLLANVWPMCEYLLWSKSETADDYNVWSYVDKWSAKQYDLVIVAKGLMQTMK